VQEQLNSPTNHDDGTFILVSLGDVRVRVELGFDLSVDTPQRRRSSTGSGGVGHDRRSSIASLKEIFKRAS
jgi:hypothetical protein